MDKELKQELDWINTNLTTIAENQAFLYAELKKLEQLQPHVDELQG